MTDAISIPAWGALLALSISIFLILKRISPAYALMLGAFLGGTLAVGDPSAVVSEMTRGAQDILSAILRVLTAGALAGVMIKTGSAKKIAVYITDVLGKTNASLALVLAAFILTASGVFVDIAILTVAPIALAVASRSGLSRSALLVALVGGGKSGNVISPNPNTISAASEYGASLLYVMAANIPAALVGILSTVLVVKLFLEGSGEKLRVKYAPSRAKAEDRQDLPNIFAALSGPAAAVGLLVLRPVCGISIDPMVALPGGALVCALFTSNFKKFGAHAKFGLGKMAPIASLLLGTGCLAGIIKASTLKSHILGFMELLGAPDILIAPVSGALMSCAAASTVAGSAIAAGTFSDAVLASGISAAWGAAMTNAGAVALDQMPHGSFFHVTGGSVGMGFSGRLKCVPWECLIGALITLASVVSCWIAM